METTVPQRRCLLTGATGALGPAVAQHLENHGYELRILSRNPDHARAMFPGLAVLPGDICDRGQVDSAVDGCQVIVHLAAFLHVSDPSPAEVERYQDVNVRGTATIVESAVAHAVSRVVLASTIAVYGDGRGAILDESSEPNPDTPYAKSKLQAERLVLEAPGPDGRSMGAVLRLAAVYGPRVKGNYRRLLDAIARGRFVPIGRGANRRTVVHEIDVAASFAAATDNPRAAGQIFNVTDGQYHRLSAIVSAIYTALGRPQPRLVVPLPPVRAAARVTDCLCRAAGRDGWCGARMLEKYLEDVCVCGARLTKELDVPPAVELHRGWSATVKELRAAGEIPA